MILVVEDNAVSGRIIEANLRRAKYDVVVARNGREALDILAERPDVDLVITDISMPELDGLGLIEAMQNKLEWSEIPVIVASGLADAETVKRAAAIGIRRFLVKPIVPTQLLEEVGRAVRSSLPVLGERSQVMRKLSVDLATYRELLKDLRDATVSQIREISTALEGDPDEEALRALQAAARSTSETANLLGAERLVAALEHQKPAAEADPRSWLGLVLRELRLLEGRLPARGDGAEGPEGEEGPAEEGAASADGLEAEEATEAGEPPANA